MKLDTDKYELELAMARRASVCLSVVNFDPSLHPRDWKGQFKKSLTGMRRGDVRKLPSGVTVEKKYANYKVSDPGGDSISPKTLDQAVDQAMRMDAASTHPDSLGGAKSTTVSEAAKQAKGSVEPKVVRSALEKMGLQHSHLLDKQLASARDHILDRVDPPGKPPAKDGTEALQRLKVSGRGAGRGSSWLPVMDETNPYTIKSVWEAVEALRG